MGETAPIAGCIRRPSLALPTPMNSAREQIHAGRRQGPSRGRGPRGRAGRPGRRRPAQAVRPRHRRAARRSWSTAPTAIVASRPWSSPGPIPTGSSATPRCGGSRRGGRRSQPWVVRGASAIARAARRRRPGPRAGASGAEDAAGGAVQLERLHPTFLRMNPSGVIFVAALNGSALGLGAEFAWACDLRVMADGDYFIGQPEVLLGNHAGRWRQPAADPPDRHPQVTGGDPRGKPFTPAQALANGAVDEVVAPGDVLDAGDRARRALRLAA